jgi:acyl-CoA synthetase (AMP-forming)/AMP-acid ligase II
MLKTEPMVGRSRRGSGAYSATAPSTRTWRHAEIRTLPDIVRHWARTTPHAVAVCDPDSEVTYQQMDTRSSAVANTLLDSGMLRGEHVGYLGPNSAFFWVAWMGAAKAGAVLTPLNWRSAVPELVALIDDAQFRVVFCDASQVLRLEAAVAASGRVCRIVALNDVDDWLAGMSSIDPALPASPTDVALMSYTSGTTGRPKGVQITHQAFDRYFMMSSLEPTESWSSDDVALMVMPNFHLAGTWLSLPALYHGGTVAVLPVFDPATFFNAVDRYRPTVAGLVPTALDMIVNSPAAQTTDFGSLRRIVYAGSPIRAEAIRAATTLLGCELLQFYGTTETYIITLLRPEQHDPSNTELLGSCGQPFPLVDVRIVDPETGTDTADRVGEILVRSPMMFAGYWNAPELTADAFRGSWYRTGDLGRQDDAGNLHLVDRLKDMIVTGGENVYSIEVESALTRHPSVLSAAVIGTPDATWGEAVTAFVVTSPGDTLDAADLIAFCRTQIASYKTPKAVHFVAALPETASGKTRKDALRTRNLARTTVPR